MAAIESAGIRVINLVVNVQFSHLKPFLLPPGHRYFSKLDTLLSIIIKLDDGAGASTQFWGTTMGKKGQILSILSGQQSPLSVKKIGVVGLILGLARDVF